MNLPENTDRIILYKKYGEMIEANLAKTKLDAFAIPCFLTNENISSLYPLPYMQGMEVGLYIFEEDKVRVREVLDEVAP